MTQRDNKTLSATDMNSSQATGYHLNATSLARKMEMNAKRQAESEIASRRMDGRSEYS
jgi:hypothetical protein